MNAHTTAEDAFAKHKSNLAIHDLASLAALETRVSQLESDLSCNTDSGPAGDEKAGPASNEKVGKASTHESAPPDHVSYVLGHYGNKLGKEDLQVIGGLLHITRHLRDRILHA